MAKEKDAVIGYFAFYPPQDVLCDGDACVIAGSQSSLNKYIKSPRQKNSWVVIGTGNAPSA